MSQWIGCSVSIHCGDTLGTYQGQIAEATGSTITLVKAFRNGLPYPRSEVTLNSCDIQDIEFIKLEPPSDSAAPSQSTVTVAKPIPKRANKSLSLSEGTSPNKNGTSYINNVSKTKNDNVQLYPPDPYELDNTPNGKKDKNRLRWKKYSKDEACFGNLPSDHSFQKDFDFEKNLALFNKQAIWDKLNAAQKPDVVRQTVKNTKYRHDENVIATLPTEFREIHVPDPDTKEYVTDAGLTVPSITMDLRKELFNTAERYGFGWQRRSEMMGRAATEMVLQLLGGGYRLNPYNTHQAPKVVGICGSHFEGAIGLNALRQLASHGVNTIAYLPDQNLQGPCKQEFELYRLTRNTFTSKVLDLPTTSDLIILTLSGHCSNETIVSYPLLIDWINQNRSPVLAIDPPVNGTPGVVAKFSLVPVLPLSYSVDNGKIYLCNLGIPTIVFNETGIKYKSPFGSKFVIPLHPNAT